MDVVRIDVEQAAWTDDPRLADYRQLRDPQRVRRSGVFLAEGRQVVRILLEERNFELRSLLLTETALAWLQREDLAAYPGVPAYVLPAGALRAVSGHRFHQGCLAAAARPAPVDAARLLARTTPPPRFVVGLEDVTNPDNVGSIFRSAAAFGVDALLLSPSCCSPLYRKAIRTSMGAALRLPFAHRDPWPETLAALRAARFRILALTARRGAQALDVVARSLAAGDRVALLFGAEAGGLGPLSLEASEARVGIPMSAGMDCLNVGAAAAIALHALRPAARGD